MGMILFLFTLSIDTFCMGLSYALHKIKIPYYSSLVISFISSIMLLCSIIFGIIIKNYISIYWIQFLSFLLLFLFGMLKLLETNLKRHTFQIKIFKINFMIQIYLDYTKADYDHSNKLSIHEAIPLAFILSLDSLATGFILSTSTFSVFSIFFIAFLFSFFSIQFAVLCSLFLSKKTHFDLSIFSGYLFILLAFLKLLSIL